jgi:hypothetical protein
VGLVDELLLMVNWPANEPDVVGSNVKVTLDVCPGLRVTGRLVDGMEKPLPVTVMELTVNGAVPLEVNVTVCVVGVFTTTLPNGILVAFRLSNGVAALSCSETDFDVLPVAAVIVADCALLTEDTVAVNAALDAVAGTVTELGTVTALLLLARETLTPPVGADPDRLTVHESASAPVIELLLHETALTVGAIAVPVPLRLMVAVGAVLDMVSCPVTELALVGAN